MPPRNLHETCCYFCPETPEKKLKTMAQLVEHIQTAHLPDLKGWRIAQLTLDNVIYRIILPIQIECPVGGCNGLPKNHWGSTWLSHFSQSHPIPDTFKEQFHRGEFLWWKRQRQPNTVNYSPAFRDENLLGSIKRTYFNYKDDIEDPPEDSAVDLGEEVPDFEALDDEGISDALEHIRELEMLPSEGAGAPEGDTEGNNATATFLEALGTMQDRARKEKEEVESTTDPVGESPQQTRANIDGLDVIPPSKFGILTLVSFPDTPRIFVCLSCKRSFKSTRAKQLQDHRCHEEKEKEEQEEMGVEDEEEVEREEEREVAEVDQGDVVVDFRCRPHDG
ncbi:hypothetical protein FRC19_000980 [Serendipita sp. 401]|nr:hypothetical protein FRC19_000980 [Serendipita sp. 401]KAG9042431.1 hypothetical protein FS842_002191 [Serendipita sp. 407]